MTNTNLVDNFNRARVAFIMTQPPTGQLVCRMNRATLDKLSGELAAAVGGEFVWGAPAAALVKNIPPGYEGMFQGVLLAVGAVGEENADGEFAFSVQIKGSGKTGHEFARWMPVDCSGPVEKLEEALVPVLMTFGPTFSSADAIQDRLDQLADLVMLPDPEVKPAKLTALAI